MSLTSGLLSFAGTIVLGIIVVKQTHSQEKRNRLSTYQVFAWPVEGAFIFSNFFGKQLISELPKANCYLVEEGVDNGYSYSITLRIRTDSSYSPDYIRVHRVILFDNNAFEKILFPLNNDYRLIRSLDKETFEVDIYLFLSKQTKQAIEDLKQKSKYIFYRYKRGIISLDVYQQRCLRYQTGINLRLDFLKQEVVTHISTSLHIEPSEGLLRVLRHSTIRSDIYLETSKIEIKA